MARHAAWGGRHVWKEGDGEMSEPEKFDALVIGSGQGGTPLVYALAAEGRKVALIERKHIGGTCINEGCTPTKTMAASARVAYLAKRAGEYGVETGPVRVNMRKVRLRKQRIVDDWRTGDERRLRDTRNVELITGSARFVGRRTAEVGFDEGTTPRVLTAPLALAYRRRLGRVGVLGDRTSCPLCQRDVGVRGSQRRRRRHIVPDRQGTAGRAGPDRRWET